MICRPDCAACCIAPAITQAIPNMPQGKPTGVACVNLDLQSKRCRIWQHDNYPKACRDFTPERAFCGANTAEAMQILQFIETTTAPS